MYITFINMKKIISLLLFVILSFNVSLAFESSDSLFYQFYFPVGKSELNLSFRNNGATLDSLVANMNRLNKNAALQSVSLHSGASPEGGSTLNKRLSADRLQALKRMVQRHTSVPDSVFHLHSLNEDWVGLLLMVEKSEMPYKEDVLRIIRNTPVWVYQGNAIVDSRKRQLMSLYGGCPWRYMVQHFFPELRSGSVVVCKFKTQNVSDATTASSNNLVKRDTVILRDTVIKQVVCRDTIWLTSKWSDNLYMGLKTNLLYDALLVPNIGLEFYLGKGWSIGGNYMHAWWKNDKRHRYWRVYGGDVALRKYFGSRAAIKPLSGHHLGIYVQAITYDFEWGGKGYMGGKPGGDILDKAHFGVGFEYGYSLAIAKRLNLDFTLGCGYLGGTYYEYSPMDNHYVWKATKKRNWFGPTKAEVSLVWLLGGGYGNEKKNSKIK